MIASYRISRLRILRRSSLADLGSTRRRGGAEAALRGRRLRIRAAGIRTGGRRRRRGGIVRRRELRRGRGGRGGRGAPPEQGQPPKNHPPDPPGLVDSRERENCYPQKTPQ